MFLVVFIDGIGIGGPGPENPFVGLGGDILGALGGDEPRLPPGTAVAATDATLGVQGRPQSATGQATILTGVNAAALLGRHAWGFPNERLRTLVLERSLLRSAHEAGLGVAFLNPLPVGWATRRDPRRIGCCTWAAIASGEPLRTPEDLLSGRAVGFDLTGDVLRAHGWPAPRTSPDHAGRALVRAAREVDLALFEYFLPDMAGHSRDMGWARLEVRRLREMLDGILAELGPDERLCVTSDHGNMEDLSSRSHTRNHVPTIWSGPRASDLARDTTSLADIAPLVLREVGVDQP